MSHFTVLVIGEDPREQLEPFQENNNGDCPEEYLKYSIEDKDGEEYLFDSEEEAEQEAEELDLKLDKETGAWINPNAKWDFYQLGGRFGGNFILKNPDNANKYEATEYSFMNYHDELDSNRVDQAIKGEIDFEEMKKEKMRKMYQDIKPIYNLFPDGIKHPEKTLKEFIEEYGNDKGQQLYIDQPEVRTFMYETKKNKIFTNMDSYRGYDTVEEYVNSCNYDFYTFAIIKDGQWISKGEMGFFGISNDEMNQEDWLKKYKEILDELPDDTLLTVFDCHI